MKHTKNDFKQKIKNLNIPKLKIELHDLEIQLHKAYSLVQKGMNPYHKGHYPIKLLKWKKNIIHQLILKKENERI